MIVVDTIIIIHSSLVVVRRVPIIMVGIVWICILFKNSWIAEFCKRLIVGIDVVDSSHVGINPLLSRPIIEIGGIIYICVHSILARPIIKIVIFAIDCMGLVVHVEFICIINPIN